MTPKELLNLKDTDYLAGLSTDIKTFMRYRNDNCVVAYRKSYLGTTFIMKGKIELFGFVMLIPQLRWGNRELLRKGLKSIQLMFKEDGEEKVEVVNEEQFRIFERRVLLEGLKDD